MLTLCPRRLALPAVGAIASQDTPTWWTVPSARHLPKEMPTSAGRRRIQCAQLRWQWSCKPAARLGSACAATRTLHS